MSTKGWSKIPSITRQSRSEISTSELSAPELLLRKSYAYDFGMHRVVGAGSVGTFDTRLPGSSASRRCVGLPLACISCRRASFMVDRCMTGVEIQVPAPLGTVPSANSASAYFSIWFGTTPIDTQTGFQLSAGVGKRSWIERRQIGSRGSSSADSWRERCYPATRQSYVARLYLRCEIEPLPSRGHTLGRSVSGI